VLTGSGFLANVHSPYKTEEKSNCGHLAVAINIEAFQPLAEYNKRMEAWVGEVKSVPLAQGTKEVFYPGEMEARNDERNRKEGILFPDDTLADLKRIAEIAGLQAKLPF
jgi:LDH2 family malate/lactate/ureidoglycolate dehydrogenase